MPRTLAIMQPYFFPYIGYFQLMKLVDEFVVYDNIQYTKKGWINRNRILVNGKDEYISIPLKKDSDFLDIKGRYLAETWPSERKKLINKISESYRKAPMYKAVMPLVETCLNCEKENLFEFIMNSLGQVKEYLSIKTPVVISSGINVDHQLKSAERVIAICKEQGADKYINPIGGIELYSKEKFGEEGIELGFLKSENIIYPQFNNEFVPYLSILDVMMFNDKDKIGEFLNKEFTLQ
jgi:hypothetical protein